VVVVAAAAAEQALACTPSVAMLAAGSWPQPAETIAAKLPCWPAVAVARLLLVRVRQKPVPVLQRRVRTDTRQQPAAVAVQALAQNWRPPGLGQSRLSASLTACC